MPMPLKEFQTVICDGIVAQFGEVRALYRQIAAAAPDRIDEARRKDAAIVLQAPTGAGKTRMAIEVMRRLSVEERVLWFWFAPFTGLVEQSRKVLTHQAPELAMLELDADRQLDAVRGGGVFVVTWASLAARKAESRRARQRGDAGMSIDDVIAMAREQGLRIGCVVDEAHHGFQRETLARAFFCDVLKPDYALLMTATPRDTDMKAFERATGYFVGEPADWASVSRADAVDAGLLKRGVRMVRFIARDGDTAQLVDFEHLALRECVQMHRTIRKTLVGVDIALTPLMLVQVPDGKVAQEAARTYLVEQLGFDATAVRVHTAAEPDPDLLLLAQDPTVEVLIFKMAVALGFDAPRAFTLAALRGTRDPSFGVQVIGRIMRRHALLQAQMDALPVLDHGYVFLANSESQEGLLLAGAQINTLTKQAPELGTQTVVTMIGDGASLQVVRSGEPLSCWYRAQGCTCWTPKPREMLSPRRTLRVRWLMRWWGPRSLGWPMPPKPHWKCLGARVLGLLRPKVSLVHLCWLKRIFIGIRVVTMLRIVCVEKNCRRCQLTSRQAWLRTSISHRKCWPIATWQGAGTALRHRPVCWSSGCRRWKRLVGQSFAASRRRKSRTDPIAARRSQRPRAIPQTIGAFRSRDRSVRRGGA
ncbi:hypothetical protein XPU_0994 [Xanthomonas arboricola pv. pruni str. MAFF 311562]|uniref:Helicase ATP-binding domain-containing protein n=1 Tax=Xanthomonas arboricola pv. pruni str. MAFF 311562 TaxID=1414836 RepID=W4RZC2_9XANT|nr:hypothetical protein XPU_0994 [Xanthomonas arboricola pv. pruni str. MAFF 311562]